MNMTDEDKFVMACAERRIRSLRAQLDDAHDTIRTLVRVNRTSANTIETLRRACRSDPIVAVEQAFKK